jgi:ATP-dependent exoDNAse (exonuclease V) beta subunit
VAIGALDSPELEERLGAGTAYRLALEAELRQVVASAEWRWYVEGAHWRELRFVHLRNSRRWRAGAFDLFRAGDPRHLIVDFKTHDIGPDAVERTAGNYAVQVAVYRAAARAAGREAVVRLHFTRPNRVWEAT